MLRPMRWRARVRDLVYQATAHGTRYAGFHVPVEHDKKSFPKAMFAVIMSKLSTKLASLPSACHWKEYGTFVTIFGLLPLQCMNAWSSSERQTNSKFLRCDTDRKCCFKVRVLGVSLQVVNSIRERILSRSRIQTRI